MFSHNQWHSQDRNEKNPVITGHKRINLNMDSHENKLHFIVKNK